jgi:3-phenylpropionate/trans-cinnamate dioxygenase ferredoxin subunit
MNLPEQWIKVCPVNEIDKEDVVRFDQGDRTFAIFRSSNGDCFATDGMCTHEKVHLANGLVMGSIIECPKHNGRFDYKTGEPKRAPVCEALKTYPTMVVDGIVYLSI